MTADLIRTVCTQVVPRVRPGKSADAFALAAILEERQADTRYAGHASVDPKLARQLFAQAAMRHGHTNDGGMFLMVHETRGEIDAFILGALTRIYMVFDKFAATDVFLLGKRDCDPRALNPLVDAYITWAEANPRVHEIGLSWADTLPNSRRITKSFIRRGFTLCGETYRREVRHPAEVLAA